MSRTHVQRNFSGGEISSRMLMRADTEVYNRSVLEMENFQPTLQGGFERSPGTRFAYDTGKTNVRLIPYLTPANESGFVELAYQSIKIRKELIGILGTIPYTVNTVDNGVQPAALTPYRKQIVVNSDLNANNSPNAGGADPWVMEPEEYTVAGDPVGCSWTKYLGGFIRMQSRIWKQNDPDTCTVTHTAEVDEDTSYVTIAFRMDYLDNFANDDFPDDNGGYETTIKVGKSAGAGDVLDWSFDGTPGTIKDLSFNEALDGGALWTGTLYITVTVKATVDKSAPLFRFHGMSIWADGVIDIVDDVIGGETPPWTWSELDDIHFIQSPYSSSDNSPQKQLVFVHPNHQPYMLFFNADAGLTLSPTYPNPGDIPVGYVLLKCVFNNQPNWTAGTYPNTCASFNGRLILAGAQDSPVLGSPISPYTETVWGTEVGDWLTFSGETGVNADDSIEFTTIYRSPIQWAYGQKSLLVGASNMEYSASADGIFQPADIGVEMHSTHGSNHVQPTGFGKSVLFSADGGTRVRELMLQNEDQGWVAPDLTLLSPELCSSGIRRMVRMRNPHQMLIVLLNDGQLAVLHQDTQAGIFGWSRMKLTKGTRIKDICIVNNNEGEDILFMSVFRNIGGVSKLYVESIPNWVDGSRWEYLLSATRYIPEQPTNVFSGLGHLEGKYVDVVSQDNFIGTYLVTGGTVTILDQQGNPINLNGALIGLPMTSRVRLLPPVAEDPGSAKSYEAVSLRIRNSTRPKINGVRPADRSPSRIMGNSEELEEFEDVEVTQLSWDIYQVVTIEEDVPLRTEVLGVYGSLQENTL